MRAARSNRLPSLALIAALLTLALLSSAVPLTVLSAAHSCSMPCCAGADGSCATGACKDALFKKPKKSEEEKLCGTEGAQPAHATAKESHSAPPVEASTNSDHCNTVGKESSTAERREASREEQTGTTDPASARALAAPCPKDCCTGASASTQSRRGRDAALLSALDRRLPPALIFPSLYSRNLPPLASAHLKRLRARAPPPLLPSNPA